MVNVVVGVLKKDDKYLIAQRRKGSHQELKWEFPGGKPENSETDNQTLIREFKEELDLDIEVKDYICNLIFKYPLMEVNVNAYYVYCKNIENLKLNVHKDMRWVSKKELSNFDLVGADIEIIKKFIQ